MPHAPRTLICDKADCRKTYTEPEFGAGFPGWGELGGILISGQTAKLCPACLAAVANFIDPAGGER